MSDFIVGARVRLKPDKELKQALIDAQVNEKYIHDQIIIYKNRYHSDIQRIEKVNMYSGDMVYLASYPNAYIETRYLDLVDGPRPVKYNYNKFKKLLEEL